MFFFLLIFCCILKKEDFLENVHILSCFVQLKSVLSNLLCVSDLLFFFRTLVVNSVSDSFVVSLEDAGEITVVAAGRWNFIRHAKVVTTKD